MRIITLILYCYLQIQMINAQSIGSLSTIPYRSMSDFMSFVFDTTHCAGDTIHYTGLLVTQHPNNKNFRMTYNQGSNLEIISIDSLKFDVIYHNVGFYYSNSISDVNNYYYLQMISDDIAGIGGSIDTLWAGSIPITTTYCTPKISLSHLVVELCTGQYARLSAKAQRVAEQWAWSSSGGEFNRADSSDVELYFDSVGLYRIQVIGSNPAGADTLEHWINVVAAPMRIDSIADMQIHSLRRGDSLQMKACGEGAHYLWSPATDLSCIDCANPVLHSNFVGTTDYQCTVTNGGDCPIICKHKVEVKDEIRYFAPTAFSPNGDFTNDIFEIYGIDIDITSMSIYDRWGAMLYKEYSSHPKWDGGTAEIGVYIWLMECVDRYTGQRKVRSGNVTLVK
jgi:gliding motility-associated-like protein